MRREQIAVISCLWVLPRGSQEFYKAVVRAKKIFGQERLIIVSQRFHVYRALTIARRNGIDAVAVCAENESLGYRWPRVREVAARAVALFDLYVWNRQPRFLGKREAIEF